MATGVAEGATAVGAADFFWAGVGELAATGGKLGSGREVSVSFGIGVRTSNGVSLLVGVAIGVVAIAGVVARGETRRRERGPGLIGRTGSKYWVSRCSARFCCDSLTVTVGCAVSVGCALADVVGEGDTPRLSVGGVFGVSVGA